MNGRITLNNHHQLPCELTDAKVVLTSANDIIPLRNNVLRHGFPVEEVIFDEDNLSNTRHYAIIEKESVIACVSLIESSWNNNPAWRLRAMAVEQQYRGMGAGKALLSAALDDLVQINMIKPIWCYSRTSSRHFYEKFGFTTIGDAFTYGNAGDSIKMVRSNSDKHSYKNRYLND